MKMSRKPVDPCAWIVARTSHEIIWRYVIARANSEDYLYTDSSQKPGAMRAEKSDWGQCNEAERAIAGCGPGQCLSGSVCRGLFRRARDDGPQAARQDRDGRALHGPRFHGVLRGDLPEHQRRHRQACPVR